MSAVRRCRIPGCDGVHMAKGWCNLHYRRWLNHGDPLEVGSKAESVPERFFRLVTVQPVGCWLWRGSVQTRGYGSFAPVAKVGAQLAHRYAYELLVAPVPDGLTLDHLCRNKLCVKPSHLEPVTIAENNRRRDVPDGFREPQAAADGAEVAA